MFKKVLLSLFILLSSKSFGYSQQNYMRDFGEVIKQENSVSNQVYIFERCAGLLSAIGARFVGSGRADAKDAGEKMIAMGSEFMIVALTVAKSGDLNYTEQNAITESIEIGKIYKSIMDDNHRRTGNAIAGQILDDQRICGFFYKELSGQ